ncbi:MAG: N-acetyltransferase [Hyphomicrobiales bacterium]|nr:MAG: N-acetyltransferase [Hyphomicrobiales bacterium]
MPTLPTLAGQFVNLRPLRAEDAEVTLAWRQGERARLLNKGAKTLDAQIDWIRRRPSSEYNFIIELKDLTPIGMLSLIDVNTINRHAEPARFLIGDEAAARGAPAAVEAMKLLYEFAFDTLGLNRLFGTVVAGNRRMAIWQTYLGMRQEGVMREHYFIDGKLQDAIMFGLLVSDYRTVSLPRMTALIALSAK